MPKKYAIVDMYKLDESEYKDFIRENIEQ